MEGAYPIDMNGEPAVLMHTITTDIAQISLNIIVAYLLACVIAHIIYKYRK